MRLEGVLHLCSVCELGGAQCVNRRILYRQKRRSRMPAAKPAPSNYSKGLSKEVSPKGYGVVRAGVETEAAVRLVTVLAEKSATDRTFKSVASAISPPQARERADYDEAFFLGCSVFTTI